MISRAALIRLDADAGGRGAAGLELQRRFARIALARCAELCGAPSDGWRQDDDRVPIANGRFHWSISHKRGCAAAVISDQPVGIDVERIAPRGSNLFDKIATTDEWALLGGRCWDAFFRMWTAKEATLKANGAGIGRLDECRLRRVVGKGRVVTTLGGREWTIEHHAWDDHLVAVTVGADGVSWHHFDQRELKEHTQRSPGA